MGKKFMIVRPKPCCGYDKGIGLIFEGTLSSHKGRVQCTRCGKIEAVDRFISFKNGGNDAILESRIIWIPEENDVIEYDQQNNIDETAKA